MEARQERARVMSSYHLGYPHGKRLLQLFRFEHLVSPHLAPVRTARVGCVVALRGKIG